MRKDQSRIISCEAGGVHVMKLYNRVSYQSLMRFMCALRVLNSEREQWAQKRMCEILCLPPSQPSALKENSLCGVYARLQRKEGKQAACLSGSRAPSACWDQLVPLRHRNAVLRLEVSWTARRQTRQARHRGFVESGSTAEITGNICRAGTGRSGRGRSLSVCLLQLFHKLGMTGR